MFGDGYIASCKASAQISAAHARAAFVRMTLCRRGVGRPRHATSARLQPISESDLAKYMADCIREPQLWDQVRTRNRGTPPSIRFPDLLLVNAL